MYQPIKPINPIYQYSDGYMDQQNQFPTQPPMQDQMMPYSPRQDLVDTYGSIIKDLTDTDKLLDEFELRLRGKVRTEQGKVVDDPAGTAYIKTDRAARDFVNIVKSIVNRHTDFSFYEVKEGYALIDGACKLIPEWLMYQGGDVPKGYRVKIGFEALSLIKASVHKAINGRMLTWTKGAINEQASFNSRPETEKKGLMDFILPFRKKAG